MLLFVLLCYDRQILPFIDFLFQWKAKMRKLPFNVNVTFRFFDVQKNVIQHKEEKSESVLP